jgi:MarR family transcriptional regulator, lower aerobic nicotinate degradation pathway regulator
MKNQLVELVNLWAEYEERMPGLTIEEFCRQYLAERIPAPAHESDDKEIPINGQLAELIGKLNRYAGLYCKKALAHVGMDNIDDWVYLISLHSLGTPKKSELIYDMVSEFPSGIDIIKRLVRLDLVEEFPDLHDRRSKRLKITQKGIQVLMESFPYMDKVGSMAFDTLSPEEKTMIFNILKRLDNFHAGHYKNVRNADFGQAFGLLTHREE